MTAAEKPPVPLYTSSSSLPGPTELSGKAVLVDKPYGWSSFKVVRRLRSLTGIRKVGHAGTLDPMATGLLIVLVGRPATRNMEAFMGLDKRYEGTLRLGATTASYDAETPVEDSRPWIHVQLKDLEALTPQFTGAIKQYAPMYSAVKVKGERLYKKARRGEQVERPPRYVEIYTLEWLGQEGPDVRFRVRCSKGTYIRSLAHDVGQALGCGAHLIELRRTAIGSYHVDEAWTPEELTQTLRPAQTDQDL